VVDISVVTVWLLLCVGLGLAGGSIAVGGLPQLGHYAPAFGLPIALSLLGIVGLWIGHVSIALGLWVGLALLTLGAVLATKQQNWWHQFRAGLPAYALFTVAFLLMILLRSVDPAVNPSSGEKFLNFGLLTAHLEAAVLPAEDIWFAGEPFSYYYGGHFVASLLARLTGTPARFAYNLSLATFYATLVTAAYGLSGAIGRRWSVGRSAALLGAFFVGFASNLLTVARLAAWALPDLLVSAFVSQPAAQVGLAPGSFDYWPASRIVPGMISEFPLFAYLNGDLHAHMLAMPFQLLLIAILYVYFWLPADRRRYRIVLLFGVVPAISGFVTATNAWALPVLAGLVWLTLYFAPAPPATLGFGRLWSVASLDQLSIPTWPTAARRLIASTLTVAVVMVFSVGWSLPFWSASATSGMSLAFFPSRSPLSGLLLVHGGFLIVLVPYLVRRLSPDASARTRVALVGSAVVTPGVLFPDFAGVVLFGVLAVVAWFVLRRTRSVDLDSTGYEAILAFGGLSLVVLVELVYLQEPAVPGRFNTFFKTYAQIWLLFGVAAGVVVARYLASNWSRPRPKFSGRATRGALVSILLLSMGVYGAGAVHQWTTADSDSVRTPDDPTLDALSFAEQRYPDQMAAINWLDDRSGTPTIASAPGAYIWKGYHWVNAPSSLTGLPTAAGWAHQAGYRGSDTYWGRVDDVGLIFNGSRQERYRHLERYDVRYVFYGPIERDRYGTGLFRNESAVTPVFEADNVTIFRVNQSAVDRQEFSTRPA
jgi:YYY domain-containing protein